MGNVVIVGAGPAGATLALLLARREINVTLVERQRDFAREFRGEVLVPSGIEALEQMGLHSALTEVPHHSQQHFSLYFNGKRVFDEVLEEQAFDGRLPMAISQTAFLEHVVGLAQRLPHFRFERGVSVKELQQAGGRVTGVTIRQEGETRSLPCDLVIGADGRYSIVRRSIGAEVLEMNPPMDIVWCKLPRPDYWQDVRAYLGRGHLLVAYHTWDDSLQLGWVILKGQFTNLRNAGVDVWVEEMANHVCPELAEHLRAHKDNLEHPFLLQSVSDRVKRWSAQGALLIGDAAHTMSPVGAQGINIALRDAIVAANHLAPALGATVNEAAVDAALAEIEAERLPEVEQIQQMQARPPRLVLSQSWWGEPIRRVAALALARRSLRLRAARGVAAFPFGITDVRLSG
jgi:2-polyprenyl-6-methoxyphenol hydroxylase-like FAD-dependent oxidoreductase